MNQQVSLLPAGYEATVWIWNPRPGKAQAICDCGHKGPRRLFKAHARRDLSSHPHTPTIPWWRKTYHKRPVLVASLMLWLLPVAAYFSAKAHADPETVESYTLRNATSICALLSQDDSDAGISNIIATLVAHGLSYYQSGEVLGLSTLNVCPQYNDRVLDWAHAVTGTGQVSTTWKASEHIGGVIA